MDRNEINKELQMTYDNLCKYLQAKYGIPKSNYFANKDSKSRNKAISRTAEGLFCHHILETIGSNLNVDGMAQLYPYEYQHKENLLYCNYIEHLILHIKIMVITNPTFDYPGKLDFFFHSGGFAYIGTEINSLFMNDGSKQAWRNTCYGIIKDNFEDYISILKGAIQYTVDNFTGEKNIEIETGTVIPLYSLHGIVTPNNCPPLLSSEFRKVDKVSKLWNYVIIEDVKEKVKLDLLKKELTLDRVIQRTIKEISSTDSTNIGKSVWEELSIRLAEPITDAEKNIARWLKEANATSEWKAS